MGAWLKFISGLSAESLSATPSPPQSLSSQDSQTVALQALGGPGGMACSLSADRHAPAALPGGDCGCFGAQVHAEKVSVATQPQTSPEAHLLVPEGAGSESSD